MLRNKNELIKKNVLLCFSKNLLTCPCKGCPKINARFEFAAICAVKCWQPKKKNNLTADSLGLVKMERYTIDQRVFIIEQYFKWMLIFRAKSF